VIEAWGHDGIRPEQGWRWTWPTSHLTDYAYAFDGGKVDASAGSSHWFDPLDRPSEDLLRAQPELPDDAFPRMGEGPVRRPPAWQDLFGPQHPA